MRKHTIFVNKRINSFIAVTKFKLTHKICVSCASLSVLASWRGNFSRVLVSAAYEKSVKKTHSSAPIKITSCPLFLVT